MRTTLLTAALASLALLAAPTTSALAGPTYAAAAPDPVGGRKVIRDNVKANDTDVWNFALRGGETTPDPPVGGRGHVPRTAGVRLQREPRRGRHDRDGGRPPGVRDPAVQPGRTRSRSATSAASQTTTSWSSTRPSGNTSESTGRAADGSPSLAFEGTDGNHDPMCVSVPSIKCSGRSRTWASARSSVVEAAPMRDRDRCEA